MAENTLKRIKQYLDYKGIRIRAFERVVGMSNGSFASQLKNNKTIGVDKLENILHQYPDINSEWLLKGNGDMLLYDTVNEGRAFYRKTEKTQSRNIPVYDIETVAEIADLLGETNSQKPISFLNVPRISQYDGALYLLDDSMYPLLKSGDIVVFKKINNLEDNIIWGEMYLIYVKNDNNEFFLTRYLRQSEREGYAQFVSYNSHYQTLEFPISSIKAIALIKASVRVNSLF
ncbi:S24 family peptidase [Flavobacterium johnsoniae]|uniref:Phage repressor protein C, contains Cro/C1-type HTH and peptisase s24 domains n=1 Tax=Flavobacterium johnsoniae TaxID=986 RepID=A0A1M5FRU2_FLAJO|nr:S24 family peptidase [Flavobacterium johnsoniae]SHF94218.1 Phage repressor protein C, contains Cro/C1-type HTH and peptisase s24 domains [Flavobacterium johnsoniae]